METVVYITVLFVGMYFLNRLVHRRNIKIVQCNSNVIFDEIEQLIDFEIQKEYSRLKLCCEYIAKAGFPFIAIERDDVIPSINDDIYLIKSKLKKPILIEGSSKADYEKSLLENYDLTLIRFHCRDLLLEMQSRQLELMRRFEFQLKSASIIDEIEKNLSDIYRYVDEFVKKNVWQVNVTVSYDEWIELNYSWHLFCEKLKSVENIHWWRHENDLNRFCSWSIRMLEAVIMEHEQFSKE